VTNEMTYWSYNAELLLPKWRFSWS